MDFVGALPKTVKGFDSIWVVVDRLTKSTYFIPIKTDMSVARLAEIYIEQIVRLHGIPSSIVSNRDPRFTSKFWESLQALYGRRCRTPLCWFESGESVLLGPDVVLETTEKVKMIQEKMKASQTRQKSYHDKRRKDIEFQVGDHVFLRVNPVTGVGRSLKCRKLTPRFVGPFEIVDKVGAVAYRIALPSSLSNLQDVFHVSQLRKYV